jgi:hypothetical protein
MRRTRSKTNENTTAWRQFVLKHGNWLFQAALLLAADPATAEKALLHSVRQIDPDSSPSGADLEWIQESLIEYCIVAVRSFASTTRQIPVDMLPPELYAVIQIGLDPRMCFVLRCLCLAMSIRIFAQILRSHARDGGERHRGTPCGSL